MVVGVSCCLLLVGSDIEYWPRSGTGRRQMTMWLGLETGGMVSIATRPRINQDVQSKSSRSRFASEMARTCGGGGRAKGGGWRRD